MRVCADADRSRSVRLTKFKVMLLTDFYKKSTPGVIISLVFLQFIYIVICFFKSDLLDAPTLLTLGNVLLVFLFFSFVLLLVNFIIEKNELTIHTAYGVLLFVIFTGFFFRFLNINEFSWAHLFVLFGARHIYSLRTLKNIKLKLLDSSFFVGIAFLIYPPTILYLLLIYVGYFVFIRIYDKNLFIPLIGFIIPVFLSYTYYYVFDNVSDFKGLIEINLGFNSNFFSQYYFVIPIIFLVLMILFSFINILLNESYFERQGKRNIKVVVAHLIISIIVIGVNLNDIAYSIQFILLPSAVLIGNYLFLIKKNWLKESLLWLIFMMSIVIVFL